MGDVGGGSLLEPVGEYLPTLEEAVACYTSGDCGVVVLERPEKRNSLTVGVTRALLGAFVELSQRSLRVIVVTGTGRYFCIGAEAAALGQAGRDPSHEQVDLVTELGATVASLPALSVAAVNGGAAGVGLALALACDYRLVADNAVMATSFATHGLPGDGGISVFLPAIVGWQRARRLMIESPKLGAQEALDIGLADAVLRSARWSQEVRNWVERLSEVAPSAVRGIKRSFALPEVEARLALERDSTLTALAAIRSGTAAGDEAHPTAGHDRSHGEETDVR